MKLSVRVQTYNHEKYIAKAIESIINQVTNFKFELVIGDDFSEDNTRKIINGIISKGWENPNLSINFLNRKVNDDYYLERQKRGRLYNFVDIINHCKGEYIAILDGDDYWTDPLKLQKQVDFLQANEDYSFCFHNTSVLRDGKAIEKVKLNFKMPVTITSLLRNNFIHTSSVVFRNGIVDFENDIFSKSPMGDFPLFILLLEKGRVKYLEDYMSVYRIHNDGVWSKLSKLENVNKKIVFYSLMLKHLKKEEYKKEIKKILTNLIYKKISLGDENALELKLAFEDIRTIPVKKLGLELFRRIKNKF